MPNISLTTFVDFVVASGTTRITCVRKAKGQYELPYNPARDFYKGVRDAIVQHHRSQDPLDRVLRDVTDERKRVPYAACIRGHERWIGRRQYEWVEPDHPVVWESGELRVRVNPELGLIIRGQEYRVKLYFKAEQLSKAKVDPMLHLIQITLSPEAGEPLPGILDLQRGRLIEPTIQVADIHALLVAEAAAFVSMWDSLRI